MYIWYIWYWLVHRLNCTITVEDFFISTFAICNLQGAFCENRCMFMQHNPHTYVAQLFLKTCMKSASNCSPWQDKAEYYTGSTKATANKECHSLCATHSPIRYPRVWPTPGNCNNAPTNSPTAVNPIITIVLNIICLKHPSSLWDECGKTCATIHLISFLSRVWTTGGSWSRAPTASPKLVNPAITSVRKVRLKRPCSLRFGSVYSLNAWMVIALSISSAITCNCSRSPVEKELHGICIVGENVLAFGATSCFNLFFGKPT